MPDLFPLRLELFEAYLLIFTRVSAMVAFMPVIGGAGVPSRVKVALSALMAGVIFPFVDAGPVNMEDDSLVLILMVAGEAMIGMATAFFINLILSAIQLAGSFIDFQVGFGIVNVVDPATGAQVSVTTQLLNITTMLLFLSLNAHHYILSGMADSFAILPLGGFHGGQGVAEIMIDGMKAVFVASAQIAAPVTVTLLIQQAAMGLMARTVPQLNIFAVGFPFTITIGLLTIVFTMPAFSIYLEKMFAGMIARMPALFTAML
ncbi:MAG: flagellar biosynthetic protein FliR [Nitrospinae bacterium]|nr:flagellar biosynthetic protein FliR [Nitrospinota bacterium]